MGIAVTPQTKDEGPGLQSSERPGLEWAYLLPDLDRGSVVAVVGAGGAEVQTVQERWPDVTVRALSAPSAADAAGGLDVVVFGSDSGWSARDLLAARRALRPGGILLAPFPPGGIGLLRRFASLLTAARIRTILARGDFTDARFYVAIPDRRRPEVICAASAGRLLRRTLEDRRRDSRSVFGRLRLMLFDRALRLEALTPLAASGWIVAR